MSRQAHVYYRRRLAGTLTELPTGGYRFVYDSTYLEQGPAIALTLPLKDEPFESQELFSFFAGLVPEGWDSGMVSKEAIDDAD